VHVNVTSYNGIVLLTGEVPTPDIVASIGDVARTTAKVRVVHNEIVVAAASPLGSRSNDSYITSKVKTRFVEKNKFSATHVKVVTDRQVVYLMGLVKRTKPTTRRRSPARRKACCASSSCSSRSARRFRASRAPVATTPATLPEPRYPAKIATTANALVRIAALARPLVVTNGVFDLLHLGHVTYLEQAKALGASLVVAVNSDASVRRLGKGDDRPLNTLDDRMAVLAALACVDLVVPFDADTPRDLIVACAPDVLVKGGDYTAATTAGADEVIRGGGRFVAIPFRHARSTTELLERIRR
jgi:rfaE bifunctional protein nucleotidyltransferase chain/domain